MNSNIPENLIYDLRKEDKSEIKIDYRNSNYKTIEINIPELGLKSNIKLKQNFGMGKGGIFWDGSYFLSIYLIKEFLINNTKYNIKNVLELGAGTALPSIACLIKGLSVVTTDIPKMIPFIEDIININRHLYDKNSISLVKELSWEKKDNITNIYKLNNNKPFDLIIGSELIYLDDLFDDLINVLDVFSDKNTIIIFSYKIRLPEMVDEFMKKLKEKFDVIYINFELKNELYPNPDKLQIIRIIKK